MSAIDYTEVEMAGWRAAIESLAEREAIRVFEFFKNEMGLIPTQNRQVVVAPGLLLRLATFLRMCEFKRQGLLDDPNFKCPSFEAVHEELKDGTNDFSRIMSENDVAVQLACLRSLAWPGPVDLGADIVLDEISDEDQVLKAMSQLLWESRHQTNELHEPTIGTTDAE